jgi:hypothetical protein
MHETSAYYVERYYVNLESSPYCFENYIIGLIYRFITL